MFKYIIGELLMLCAMPLFHFRMTLVFVNQVIGHISHHQSTEMRDVTLRSVLSLSSSLFLSVLLQCCVFVCIKKNRESQPKEPVTNTLQLLIGTPPHLTQTIMNSNNNNIHSFEFNTPSLNVRGLHQNNKRKLIFSWVKNKKVDVAFLQETYSVYELENCWRNEWGGMDQTIVEV